MKFWGNDDIDLDEPRPLVSFTSKLNTSVDWSMKFNGENTLGNFIPAFSGDNIFASDNTGNIKSIDIKSGNINWEIETNFLSSGTAAGFGILVASDVDGNVIAFDQKDGSKIWTTNVKGEVLAPAAIDPKLRTTPPRASAPSLDLSCRTLTPRHDFARRRRGSWFRWPRCSPGMC